jgi:hypothetical protein
MILKNIGAERPRRIPKKVPRSPDAGFVVAGSAVPYAIGWPSGKFVELPGDLFKPLSKPELRVVAVLVKA